MSRDYAASLLQKGILEAKAGENRAARRFLERAIDTGGDHAVLAEAWYWMSLVTENPVEKRSALESCLSFDMRHARARRELALLDGKLDASEIISPDALPALSAEPVQATADRFMCPQCGARMVFAPDGSSLVCEHCTSNQVLGARGEAAEQDFLIAMATARGHRKPVATQVFHCHGCGAEFVLPPDLLSTTCAYCDSPHVVSLETSRELVQPEGILPHAFDLEQAVRMLTVWLEQNGITPQEPAGPPRGVYQPVWTFDIGGAIAYRGHKYDSEDDYQGRAQKAVYVDGEYPVHINDLPVPASNNSARQLAQLLPTFDLKATRPYDPRYLANWAAEVYDIPMADASLDARSRAYSRLKNRLPEDIASLYNLTTSSASLAIESFKLVFVPVWIIDLPLDGQTSLVYLNGQNGMVRGDAQTQSQSKPESGMLRWLNSLLGK